VSVPTALTPERSGVYAVAAGAVDRTQAALSAAVWLDADLARVQDKLILLQTLGRATRFPGTFGDNWDALADVLQDLSWCPADAYVLHVAHAAFARQALGEEWRTFLEIVSESAMYWKSRGKTFVALVEDAPELPQWT